MTLFVGAGLIVVVAALVQGTIGLGLSLVAVPAVALLDPTLVPGGTLILGLALPCLSLAIGFGLAVPLQRRLHGPKLRAAVLVLAGASSVAVILRSLV